MTSPDTSGEASDKAFSYVGFRLYWFSAVATTIAVQIVAVAVAWQIYDLTREPIYLGYVGLVQFLPSFALVLVTGWAADKFSRRGIVFITTLVEVACAIALVMLVRQGEDAVALIFVVLFVLGIARAFQNPAKQSLVPNLVPREALANALSVNISAWQLSTILGPVIGGLLYGLSGQVAYGVGAVLAAIGAVLVALVPKPKRLVGADAATSISTLLAGFKYIWKEKLILGAISLDLFAVLLGGATALLPVYARDILDVGPWGLGLLRAAPGVGAIIAAIVLTRVSIRRNAGIVLLSFVAGFGLFTTLFGFSTSVVWSVAFLALLGACDMVSVVVREVLIQLWTPDEVRGRVSAVNAVFIGASNEIGEFRAGVSAAFIGAKLAVVLGGIGTIGVAALWTRLFPDLRKAQNLQDGIT